MRDSLFLSELPLSTLPPTPTLTFNPRYSADLVSQFALCADMRELRVSGVPDIGDDFFASFLKTLPSLRGLRAAYLPALSDTGVVAIARCCPGLEALDLTGCTGFSAPALLTLARATPALRELRLNDVSERIDCATILGVAAACRQLRILEVARTAKGVIPAGVKWGAAAGATAFDPASGAAEASPDVIPIPSSGFCAPLAVAPSGADSSFRGSLYDLLSCVGIACPYIVEIDFAGRVPYASGQAVPDADDDAIRSVRAVVGAKMGVTAARAALADNSRHGAGGLRAIGGATAAAAARSAVRTGVPPPPSKPVDPAFDALFPCLTRLVVRRAGALSPSGASFSSHPT